MILTRPAKAEDLKLILDSWLKDWRTSKYAGVIPNNLYFATQRATIEGLIGRGAIFLIAHLEGHPDDILGWVCGELKDGMTIVHFAYTKDPYLGRGINSQLVSALPGTKPGIITHNQQLKEFKAWRWIPEVARRRDLEKPAAK